MCGDDFVETLKARTSIRSFENVSIPDSDIQRIIEAGVSAPSAGNRQPWRVVIVTDKAVKEALAKGAFGQTFVASAPVVLAVCGVPEESAERYGNRGRDLYVFQDTAALTQNILLAAHAMGYGTCWVGAFDDEEVARVLRTPSSVRPMALIPIGVPKKPIPEKRQRRPMSEVVVTGRFA
ncbi:MAG: nitroreductase family protein [Candidatus Thorarchaeota archaeon]|nr:nitroreductase family protein [Candidatus Thorarchaeota archaeon]